MVEKLKCAKAPCISCPYRKDVPSGVWSKEEYDKLPDYDANTLSQLLNGTTALFMCHQNDGNLCAGWVGAHGAHNLMALRLNSRIDPSVWDYVSPVPLFASGKKASQHGRKSIKKPGKRAREMIAKLTLLQARKGRA